VTHEQRDPTQETNVSPSLWLASQTAQEMQCCECHWPRVGRHEAEKQCRTIGSANVIPSPPLTSKQQQELCCCHAQIVLAIAQVSEQRIDWIELAYRATVCILDRQACEADDNGMQQAAVG
jgi:hypothetical protein